jgi:lipopolysaccharide export system permease protein
VEEIEDKKRLRNIFLHDRREDQIKLVVSDAGERRFDKATGEHFVTLLNGYRYDGTPGSADYSVGRFERYNLRIEPQELLVFKSLKRATFKTSDLIGSEDMEDRAELQYRLVRHWPSLPWHWWRFP